MKRCPPVAVLLIQQSFREFGVFILEDLHARNRITLFCRDPDLGK
jgi:hypothetical protein